MNKKRFCFFSTDVAGLIGKHKFKKKEDEIEHFMIRHFTGKRQQKTKVPDEHLELLKKMISDKSSVLIENQINTIHCDEQTKENMKRYVYTERGIQNEHLAIQEYEKTSGCYIQRPEEFMKKHIIKNNCSFFIGGKIDGLIENTDGSHIVIEVKNRQNKLLRRIPEYERVQIECYMRIINANKCIFIQRFEGENIIQEYTPDEILWDRILIDLSNLVKEYTTKEEEYENKI